MGAARNKVSIVIIGVLAAFVLALFCQPLAADCVSVLTNGWGSRRYLTAAAGGDRVVLVSREDADFRLTLGTADGRRTGTRRVTLPVSAAGGLLFLGRRRRGGPSPAASEASPGVYRRGLRPRAPVLIDGAYPAPNPG